MKQIRKVAAILPVLALIVAGTASAHVTVRPDSVGVGKFQTFNISVPTEQDQPTVGLRLVVPGGLEHVSPTVKPGWSARLVEEEAEGEGTESGEHSDEMVVKEIVWSGGSIPAHFRDDFTFSARVPANETVLVWKAYQTYKDGSVVAWELTPDQAQPKNEAGESDFSEFGPASQTKVVDDLKQQATPDETKNADKATTKSTDALTVSMVAVVISVLALYFSRKR